MTETYEGRPCKHCKGTLRNANTGECVDRYKHRREAETPALRERWRKARKKYRENRRERSLASGRKYESKRRKDPLVRLKEYKRNAAKRGYSWELSDERALELFSGICHHCGGTSEKMGIDRISNEPRYDETSVSCCSPCNRLKHVLNPREFVTYCANVTAHYAKRAVA